MLDAGARQTNTWAPTRGEGGKGGAKFRQEGVFRYRGVPVSACGTRMRIVALVCSFMLACCSSGGNKKGLFFGGGVFVLADVD
jgi:hypothetical protein